MKKKKSTDEKTGTTEASLQQNTRDEKRESYALKS